MADYKTVSSNNNNNTSRSLLFANFPWPSIYGLALLAYFTCKNM